MEAHRNTPLANESCAPLSEKLKPTQHILDSVYLIYHHYIKPDKMIYHSKLIENELVHLMNACFDSGSDWNRSDSGCFKLS